MKECISVILNYLKGNKVNSECSISIRYMHNKYHDKNDKNHNQNYKLKKILD